MGRCVLYFVLWDVVVSRSTVLQPRNEELSEIKPLPLPHHGRMVIDSLIGERVVTAVQG